MICKWEWEEYNTTIDVDIKGIKQGEIILCWVGVVVLGMVDEIRAVVLREITGGQVVMEKTIRGVGDEVEEEEDLVHWSLKVLWTTWFNSITKTSSFLNCFITS